MAIRLIIIIPFLLISILMLFTGFSLINLLYLNFIVGGLALANTIKRKGKGDLIQFDLNKKQVIPLGIALIVVGGLGLILIVQFNMT